MATIRELRERWLSGEGRLLQEAIERLFYESSQSRRSVDELTVGFERLPFADEVTTGFDFRGVELWRGAVRLDLRGSDFSHARLGGSFHNCRLDGARFVRCDISGLVECRGKSVCLDGVKGAGRFFMSSTLEDCSFVRANLRGATLSPANFRGSDFSGADLRRASLGTSDLRGCSFRGARLDEAVLEGALVDENTDLRGASLRGIFNSPVQNADLTVTPPADLGRALQDATTRFGPPQETEWRDLLRAAKRVVKRTKDQDRWGIAEKLVAIGKGEVGRDWMDRLAADLPDEASPYLEFLAMEAARELL
jgi:uncharacterized protein YjbI with pentapeptide repeats